MHTVLVLRRIIDTSDGPFTVLLNLVFILSAHVLFDCDCSFTHFKMCGEEVSVVSGETVLKWTSTPPLHRTFLQIKV